MDWWTWAIALLILAAHLTVDTPDHAFGVDCWEDEVVVMVVSDPHDQAGIGTFGCVPGDNLPVEGHRP